MIVQKSPGRAGGYPAAPPGGVRTQVELGRAFGSAFHSKVDYVVSFLGEGRGDLAQSLNHSVRIAMSTIGRFACRSARVRRLQFFMAVSSILFLRLNGRISVHTSSM